MDDVVGNYAPKRGFWDVDCMCSPPKYIKDMAKRVANKKPITGVGSGDGIYNAGI